MAGASVAVARRPAEHGGMRLQMSRSIAILIVFHWVAATALAAPPTTAYAPPQSPRQRLSFDAGWRFAKGEAPGADAVGFDDSTWQPVTTPHTYNDVDTFNRIISHSGGQQGQYTGAAWYRKRFRLAPGPAGRRAVLEFEGFRQAAEIFLNGKSIGLSENGVTAYGVDLTPGLRTDGGENTLAVRVDNSTKYAERATGTVFEWESRDFNPDYGGINRHVWLHLMGPVHQTLPVFDGLGTTGVYVHAANIDVAGRSADVTVDAQVANQSGDSASITLSATVVDADGHVRATFTGEPTDLVDGQKEVVTVTGRLADARWWSPEDPYLYRVYTSLAVDGTVVDATATTTGFRRTEFRGGAGTGGVYVNGRFTWLTGYAQRSSDEWAGLGQAYPDWMHDLTMRMVRDSHANYLRWMHVSPQRVDVDACDRAGVIEVCPAGDKEKDVTGRQWEQRLEVMRDSMVYYRNSPSILFWEAGNNGITADHMRQMVDLKAKWDPEGGRVIGCRTLNDPAATPVAEYFGVMIGQDAAKDKRRGRDDLFRAYSDQRRDRAPFIETEDFRDEAARRFWDDQSPPHFGFKPGPDDTYHWNSETFCLAAASRYWAYWSNRIDNRDPAHARWSGYASIYFSDSNADGRQDSSEVARVSGKVDAVRLPKEAYFAYRVMQADRPDVHIVGHWSYPPGTRKTVYVFAKHCDAVQLSLDGRPIGSADHPTDGYVYAFPDVEWHPGTLRAVAMASGRPVATHELTTAGPAVALRCTPITGPGGLKADGGDVALIDVEAVDAHGRRCPTDEARVDFAVTGPAVWRGGYNSGVVGSTNNTYLSTEDGINRVAVRSTNEPGTITVTASRAGLVPATVRIESVVPPAEAGTGHP
jgi:beta-galactosidase